MTSRRKPPRVATFDEATLRRMREAVLEGLSDADFQYDKKRRLEGQREAEQFGRPLAKKRARALAGLLLTYGDDDAHDALDALREWFWAEALPKAVKEGAAKKEPTP